MPRKDKYPEIEETWNDYYLPKNDTFCQVCGRKLTRFNSIQRGMGPVCAKRMGVNVEDISPLDFSDSVATLYDLTEEGVVLFRDDNGRPVTNVPHIVVDHSPDGYNFGYGGSGPSDLAKNILEWYIRDHFPKYATDEKKIDNHRGQCTRAADRLHQKFKKEVLLQIPKEGGFINAVEIINFLNKNL